jgi:succinyl-diaminopimelate desuccinylase
MNYLDIAQKLISFESDALHPEITKECIFYIDSLFSKDKFETEIIEHNGVYSIGISFKGTHWSKTSILLNGHIDVVAAEPHQFSAFVENEKLYGRGTVDMKATAAVAIDVLLQLSMQKMSPSIGLLLTGDEEIGGKNGAGFITQSCSLQNNFVLVIDGPRTDQIEITNREKGIAWIHLIAKGKSAHASRPWLGENACDNLFLAIERIKQRFDVTNKKGWKTTVSVTDISTTNKTYNALPEEASAILDIRFIESDASTPEELVEKIQSEIHDIAEANLRIGGCPVYIKPDHDMVKTLQYICTKINNKEVPITYSDAAHDARYFAALGIPTALIGPVGENWHTHNEWVSIESLEVIYKSLLELAKTL